MKIHFEYLCVLAVIVLNTACENDCKKIEKGTYHAIDAQLIVGKKSGFNANGYTHFKVLETDSTMVIGQITYFNKDGLTFLPLAHKYAQSTYVFTGDTVQPETLVVADYHARIEYNSECKYSFKIDPPIIKNHSFDSCVVLEFDTVSENLKIELYK